MPARRTPKMDMFITHARDQFNAWRTKQLGKQRHKFANKAGRKGRKTPKIPHVVEREARAFFTAHSLLLLTPGIAGKPESKRFEKMRWYLSQYLSAPESEKQHWEWLIRGELTTEKAANLMINIAQKIHAELFK